MLFPLVILLLFAMGIIVIAVEIDQYRERVGLPEFEPPRWSTSLMDFTSWHQFQSDHERSLDDPYYD